MAGPGICVLYLADTCTSEVHPVFNPVAPYGYLLSDMYLFMADITNPDFLGLVSTSPAFVSNSASHPAGPHGRHAQKNGKSGPHYWGRGGSTQFAQQLDSAVTAPPLVGCVVWSNTISSVSSLTILSVQFNITINHTISLVQYHY